MHSFNGVKVSKDLFCGENHYNMIKYRRFNRVRDQNSGTNEVPP